MRRNTGSTRSKAPSLLFRTAMVLLLSGLALRIFFKRPLYHDRSFPWNLWTLGACLQLVGFSLWWVRERLVARRSEPDGGAGSGTEKETGGNK